MSKPQPTELRAVVIPTGSEPATVVGLPRERGNDGVSSLRALQGHVGGLIEAVDVTEVLTDSGRRRVACTVYVNEEGKITGLPVNHRATDLAALTIGAWVHDVLVGPVVVTGLPDARGELTEVPQDVVDIISEWGWLA